MGRNKVTVTSGRAWARRKPGFWQKLGRAFCRAWFIKLRLKKPSLRNIIRWLVQASILIAISSAPYWSMHFEGTENTKKFVPYYFIAAASLIFIRWAFNEFVTAADRREELENHREHTALELQNMFKNMLGLVDVPRADFDNTAYVDVLQRTLKTILHTVNEVTDSIDTSYFQVALLVFQPNSRMEVVARSGGPRLVRRRFDRREAMAFHVANSNIELQYVPDLKRQKLFSFEGLSESDCPYRSVLLIPIYYETQDGSTEACGVVTIDSSRAYEFWNETIARRIYKQVIPFVRVLAIMLQQHPERV